MSHREQLTAAMTPQEKAEAIEWLREDAAYLRREAERLQDDRLKVNADSSETWATAIEATQ